MSELWTPEQPDAITIPHNYTPWDHQWNLWEYFQRDVPHLRGVGVWHRRAGKDISAVNLLGAKAMQRRGLYWHLFPTYQQGRKIAWDGMTSDGDRFIDTFPPDLVESVNNTNMKVTLKGGSIYQIVGGDDPDALVGANPVGIILSEWSLMNPKVWEYVEPMLLANGGWALFIYTPRGRNHGYDTYNNALEDPNWYCEKITIADTKKPNGEPIITEEQIEGLRKKGVPEEIIQQEYYCSFDASLVGAYYGQQMMAAKNQGRIRQVPYDPHTQVHTMWDLGMDDEMVVWFFQEIFGMWHIIDLLAGSGEGLDYYIGELKKKPYMSNYGNHYAPHDIKVRELGTGKSRLEVAHSKGLTFTPVRKLDLRDGINATRNILPICYFDEEKCAKGIRALSEYTKEWDEKKNVYKQTPLHDWTSHYADAFRTGAVGHRNKALIKPVNSYSHTSVTDYDLFSGF
jgi:phage terminase large subunit